jgi:hypothetical protein
VRCARGACTGVSASTSVPPPRAYPRPRHRAPRPVVGLRVGMACALLAAEQNSAPSRRRARPPPSSRRRRPPLGARPEGRVQGECGRRRTARYQTLGVLCPESPHWCAPRCRAGADFTPAPVLMTRGSARSSPSAIARTGRTAPTPAARPAEGGERLGADMGEKRQASRRRHRRRSCRAFRELPGARAELRAPVRAVCVHRDIGRVCVSSRASRRRSAACCLASCRVNERDRTAGGRRLRGCGRG